MIEWEIISSGSKGNCVIIDDVMVDCGVSFKRIKEHLYDINYLLLTHIHSDHINSSTLENIINLFPKITIIGNYQIAQLYEIDIIGNSGFTIRLPSFEVTPFECFHDVITQGYTWCVDGKNIIYATDTSSLENAPSLKFDYLFIESNHDEKKLEMARNKSKYGYDPYKGGKRHLSTQQCKTFYYLNRRNNESQLIELHKSERFY
ncbi:hypothetical protein PJ944_002854 [Listeria monocytogenes]|uniref:MBL fold metallo-hydrolase n=1 Tax=Listeria monocytogenes TaxID=1639 RepID=UPI000E6BDB1B|nr:MBL fold metallo-hydrolase [Listeria monocytogenes]EAC6664282.1 hypothetical protein [Listeria monocytogenes]EAC8532912.1 hypothetical protein [Listeria monocytogenes]EAH0754998.1 hypothetical protein [Listeria monocytogenes]EAH4149129.1 hypothetical protein [Listeria monocytogenes]EGP9918896.1 hypothetical protein [Listeria monocytogenes]